MIRDSRLVIAPPAAAAAAPAAKAHELSRQEFEQLLAKPDKLNEPAVAQGLNVAVVPRIARQAANRTVEVVSRDPGSKLGDGVYDAPGASSARAWACTL